MGLRLLYLIRNLTRNPLRTCLTAAAVGLPITIFVLSVAAVDGIDRFLENGVKQLRLAVTSKGSMANPLPEGYRRKIESLDETRGSRILAVCSMHWIGGKVDNDNRILSTLGADVDTFPAVFPDYELSPEQIKVWQTDRTAILIGAATAKQFGWKVGDRISIRPSIPPYTPMEFRVFAIPENAPDQVTNWFRRDYYEEVIKGTGVPEGWITFYFVKCATRADLEYFTTAIDRLFAGSPDETSTQDEKTFMSQFITQQFNLPRNVRILAAVTVLVAIMAAANTMSMNFRDRISEYASLKSMGFGGFAISAMVQSEALLLCGLGGLIGAAIPFVAFEYTPLGKVTIPLIQYLEIRPEICGIGLLISLGIGWIAAQWPSWLALRLNVVTALRSVG